MDPMNATVSVDAIRAILKSQYHAALAMLRDAVERCPEELWFSTEHLNPCWQVAYHALFFTHYYSQPTSDAVTPWAHHQADVQYQDGIHGPPDPNSPLPLVARPYTKAEVLASWRHCDDNIDRWVDAQDLASSESGFSWYKVSKLEHQFVNVRHIQHHTAQLATRLRTAENIGIDWVGARRAPAPPAAL